VLAVVGAALGCRWWLRRVAELPAEHAAYWARRARRPGELCLVALGDSLAQGMCASRPERGFVGLLADWLERDTGRAVAVRNWAAVGATAADVLDGQLARLDGFDAAGAEVVVLVCVGSNDVTRTDPATFRRDFARLCGRLPAGALVADVPDFRHGRHVRAAEALSAICREVLAEHPALVPVGVQAATRGMRRTELGRDLSHPGDAGHRRYVRAFHAALTGR
jgi:lysophospholipase L1-like esterase